MAVKIGLLRLGKWDGTMDWIDLAQDRGRWSALGNAVISFRAP